MDQSLGQKTDKKMQASVVQIKWCEEEGTLQEWKEAGLLINKMD
jgi:hypothetical protein